MSEANGSAANAEHAANGSATDRPAAANGSDTGRPAAANGSDTDKPAAANGSDTNKPAAANVSDTNRPAAADGSDTEAASPELKFIEDHYSRESSSKEKFVVIEEKNEVTMEELFNLMNRASVNHYTVSDNTLEDSDIFTKCSRLMKLDYKCKFMENSGGELCWNYPLRIVIPVAERKYNAGAPNENLFDESSTVSGFEENFSKYEELSKSSAVARCRSRFPVPVILYKKKFICRSGTVAVRKAAAFEICRTGVKPEGQAVGDMLSGIKSFAGKWMVFLMNAYEGINILVEGVDKIKDGDVNILKLLKIKYICDLMVEKRKIHTGISVSSSEKINTVKYGDFIGLIMPYPGCEFFKKYSQIRSLDNYKDKLLSLVFDWNATEVDSSLEITSNEMPYPEINWEEYKTWDLETLTKNYLLLLLHYLKEDRNKKDEGGLLVHCISGWDRTPLFISLLRISLWADGLIHKSLGVEQMAFLILGYDWYLFGHDLPNRVEKAEEIMHFCFKFLPEISAERFSLLSNDGAPRLRERHASICDLSDLLLKIYEETIEAPPSSSEPDAAN